MSERKTKWGWQEGVGLTAAAIVAACVIKQRRSAGIVSVSGCFSSATYTHIIPHPKFTWTYVCAQMCTRRHSIHGTAALDNL